jgi:hypothetical protein
MAMITRQWLLIAALALGAAPAFAQVDCVNAPPPADSLADSDGDGFTDAQECAGIDLNLGSYLNTGTTTVPIHVATNPNLKDVFVIVSQSASGSLLPANFNPYAPATYYGVSFNGVAALGLNVHVVTADQVGPDRTISSVSPQKAVSIAESLDINGTILGNCQWGTPDGFDGCVVFTQRVKNFIDSTCNGAGDTTTDRNAVFMAYITESFIHETGHSLGGLTSDYNSRFGGYHYKPGSGVVMEQSVTYSTKGGKCTFYISSGWNATLDPPAVRLK